MFHASHYWSGPQLPKDCGCIGFLSPMHKKIPDSYSKIERGNPGNTGLSSQQKMVVHYPRTVWKICHVEHKETGKTNTHTKKTCRGPGWLGWRYTQYSALHFGEPMTISIHQKPNDTITFQMIVTIFWIFFFFCKFKCAIFLYS